MQYTCSLRPTVYLYGVVGIHCVCFAAFHSLCARGNPPSNVETKYPRHMWTVRHINILDNIYTILIIIVSTLTCYVYIYIYIAVHYYVNNYYDVLHVISTIYRH